MKKTVYIFIYFKRGQNLLSAINWDAPLKPV